MALPIALDVAAMRPRSWPLLVFEGVLATFHMAGCALLHLLGVMAGIAHVLMAELALHDSLLRWLGLQGQRHGARHVPVSDAAFPQW